MEMQKYGHGMESDCLDHILQSDLLGDRKHPKSNQYRMETSSQRKDIFDSVSEKHRAKLEKACSFLKKKWSGLAKRVDIFFRIDLQEQSNKVIFRFVAAQFVIVSLFCMGWFFGIAGVLIYSVVLFRTICKKYYKIKQDYQRMLQATEKIASGNLDMSMEQDFGIFDPVRKQLLQIQSGFKSAVDEEVKSQKMKTELITNVSHDLKTPLTQSSLM